MNAVVYSKLQRRKDFWHLEQQAEEAKRSELEVWARMTVLEVPEAGTVGGRLSSQAFLQSRQVYS